MSIKIGINGFGRMGRLTMRGLYDQADVRIVQINDPADDAATLAHLMNFDSVHGCWSYEATADGDAMIVGDQRISATANKAINDTDWSACDLVIEVSGKMKKKQVLQAYLDQGVKRVVVTAPVKEEGVLNIVMGVNDHLYDPAQHPIVTAASCITNCLAPVVKVIHEQLGIKHVSMTTIQDITNTQTILNEWGYANRTAELALDETIISCHTSMGANKTLTERFHPEHLPMPVLRAQTMTACRHYLPLDLPLDLPLACRHHCCCPICAKGFCEAAVNMVHLHQI